LPQLVKTKFKGKDVWDDTDMMAFLEEMVNTKIKPKLKGATSTIAATATANAVEGEDDGEMPF